MAFYAIDKSNIVQSSGHSHEMGAKRDALQRLGGLTFEAVTNMADTQVDQLLRSMASTGVRVIWSDIDQQIKTPYRLNTAFRG